METIPKVSPVSTTPSNSLFSPQKPYNGPKTLQRVWRGFSKARITWIGVQLRVCVFVIWDRGGSQWPANLPRTLQLA
jgi:hypothetical protein